jgi:transcriptional regulator with XRE-family HTH domain
VSAWAAPLDAPARPCADIPVRFVAAVGRSLKLHRRERKKTQADVAEALQKYGGTTSESVVSQYESNTIGVSWERLVTVGVVLDVNLDQVFSLAELLAVEDARPELEQVDEVRATVAALSAREADMGPEQRQLLRELEQQLSRLAGRLAVAPQSAAVFPHSPLAHGKKS